ncbi:MAG: hypothetical protein LBW85_05545 [Deltaproteobacteria bacterium]|jgi:G3E family GTPase|nr:hypothetical protein [Deltaproteobacteria bacterium]
MRTVLFTGLLGSGKSTALLSLAFFLKRKGGPKSVAAVETESGEKAVASELAADKGYLTTDLTRGCIGCTSLTSGLCNTLENLLHSCPPPSWLLIEASSLGFQTIKDTVIQSLANEAQPFTVLMIEAGGWAELHQEAPLLADGLAAGADLVLVNIFDHLSPDTISAIEAQVSRVNPACPVKAARAPDLDPADAFRNFLEAGPEIGAGPACQAARGTADERASVPPAMA